MSKHCDCPIHFNIFVGLFLITLAIISFVGLFDVYLPLWLSMIILILGLLVIILNSLNNAYTNADELSVEQVNKMHAREGY